MALIHPEIPTCTECHRTLFDKSWRPVERGGKPVPRPNGMPLPCHQCPKSFDGAPHPESDLSEKNWRAYRHYLESKAVGKFPNDAIVRRNAGIIRWIEDTVDRKATQQLAMALTRKR